ncbi:MAG: hypothetical protein Q4C96_08330 [Planctomycetia bacterium]|nr:hypothetical protein [Planctomycetia bacterium]
MNQETIYFQWGRIQQNSDWLLPILAFLLVCFLVTRIYRYDSKELSSFWRWCLPMLRILALLVLLIIYLQPQWYAEREVQQNSQVVLMVDTSLSMGLPNSEPVMETFLAGKQDAETLTLSRKKAVMEILQNSPLVQNLRQKHDVILAGFDSEINKIVTLQKLAANNKTDKPGTIQENSASTESSSKEVTENADPKEKNAHEGTPEENSPSSGENPLDWDTALEAQGTETRLADAVRNWIQANRVMPLAGMVLFTDGVQNAGGNIDSAIQIAQDARIPVYSVGFGSTQPMENIRIYDVESPVRVQPNDPFTITALVQGYGLTPVSSQNNGASSSKIVPVKVHLFSRPSTGNTQKSSEDNTETQIATQEVLLSDDGKVVPVRFEVTPKELGKFTYTLRAEARPKEVLKDDNERETDIEVMDRKTKVLILAGGPTREYQFLVPTLYRDKTMEIDIFLQSAQPGISQEAEQILDDFPSTREEMFAYDCIIAVDPNWKDLTNPQIDLLDHWISQQGGGIILIAGAVYMGETVGGWIEDPNMAKIRAIYPVEFVRRFSSVRQTSFTARDPWPLDFTREGMEANFLKLEDSLSESHRAWMEFPGFYGYFPTKGPKPGASVLAWFSDPSKREGENLPVLISSQFFGAGRALYLGTGELWRLRTKNPDYFVRIYTQLIRYVSQGRMLQQSNRGRLMIARDRYTLGDSIEIRAQLTDSQLNPLNIPETFLDALLPDGRLQRVSLSRDPERSGLYTGTLTVLTEGIVRLELPLEGTGERLSRRVEIALPDLERENPQQNHLLLEHLASTTGGLAFQDSDEAIKKLPAIIPDKTRTITLSATINPKYQRDLLKWLMISAVFLLCMEWFLRRLLKLA